MCWDCISCCLEAPRGSGPCSWPLVCSGLALPSPAGSSLVSAGSFWLEADTASFHGHKHFSMLLQLQAFGVYGPALHELKAAPALAQAFQAVPSWEVRASCLTGMVFVP